MAITLENRKQKIENGKKPEAGFALLVSVIFMSVMLSFGLALGSLGYKQQVLASGAIASQYAFYAADAGLECALYADQQLDSFNYLAHSPPNPRPNPDPALIMCDGIRATEQSYSRTGGPTNGQLVVSERLKLDSDKRCADVTVYKYSTGATYLFSQGYDVPCATVDNPNGARFVSRGLKAQY